MNCQQTDEMLFAYCDGKVSPELRSEIDDHLAGCEVCQQKLELTVMENQILGERAGLPLLSEDFTSRVMQSLPHSSNPAGSTSWLNRLGSYRFYIGGTAAVAVILLALYLPGLMSVDTDMQPSRIADRSVSSDSAAEQTTELSPADTGSLEKSIAGGSVSTNQDGPASADDLAMSEESTSNIKGSVPQSSALPDSSTRVADEAIQEYQIYKSSWRDETEDIQALNDSEFDLLSLHVNNLPAEYKIDKIINTSYNVITYVYRNTVNNDILEVTIAQADTETKQQYLTDGLGSSRDQEPIPYEAAVLNSTDTSISYQGHSFQINLKSALPLEKLQEIADSIKFEEGLPNEPE